MVVFISWSGETSRTIARKLSEWLPCVVQSVQTFNSEDDIRKGSRWAEAMEEALGKAAFGIVVVTKENMLAPWIHFEAGAIASRLGSGRLCPFLFEVNRYELDGPLTQFQSTLFEKDDVLRLVQRLNELSDAPELPELVLSRSFEALWPQLAEPLQGLAGRTPARRKVSTLEVGEALNKMADQLQWLQQQARRTGEVKPIYFCEDAAEAIAGLSHELRNPLTSIRGAIELLSDERYFPQNEQGRKLLQIAHGNTDEMLRYVNQLLMLHKERGPGPADPPE